MKNRSLLALLTSAAGPSNSLAAGSFPTNAGPTRMTAFPTGVSLASDKLGLPFGHAAVVAESAVGMEVTGRAGNGLAAPVAGTSYEVAPSRVGLSGLRLDSAGEGTIGLIALPCRGGWLAADHTYWRRRLSPSRFQFASNRAITLVGATVLRMVDLAAVFAVARFLAFHTSIISQRIKERYCEIAAKRLQQGVLEL